MAVILLPTPVSFVVRAFTIPTGGMKPTLLGADSTGTPDHVIVDRLSYRFGSPKRGDLVVFEASTIEGLQLYFVGKTKKVFYIQRLVGLPGERITIADGKVFADGRQLGEKDGIPSFIAYQEPHGQVPSSAIRDGDSYVVGPDEYFVLGDNSENSLDSRYWGCVPASCIYGKTAMIYYPFCRAGRITFGRP